MARQAGDEWGNRWTTEAHILATVADNTQQAVRLLISMASQGKRKPPKFESFPRPTDRPKEEKTDVNLIKSTRAYAYLRQLRPGGEGETERSPLRLVVDNTASTGDEDPPVPSGV